MSDRDELNARLLVDLLGWLRADQFEEIKARTKWAATDRTLQITIDSYVEQGLTMVAPDGRFARPFDLSGSWEGAGMVLEAMRARAAIGIDQFTVEHGDHPASQWDVTFWVGDELYGARHESFPMAVALAAEAALKSEEAH